MMHYCVVGNSDSIRRVWSPISAAMRVVDIGEISAKRCHRSAKTKFTVMEAAYWYNIVLKMTTGQAHLHIRFPDK